MDQDMHNLCELHHSESLNSCHMSEYEETSEHVHVFGEFCWFEVFFILSQSKEFS